MVGRKSPFQTGPSLNRPFATGGWFAKSDRGGCPQPHVDGGPATQSLAGRTAPEWPAGPVGHQSSELSAFRTHINAYGALAFVHRANIIRSVGMHNCRLQALMVTCTRPQFSWRHTDGLNHWLCRPGVLHYRGTRRKTARISYFGHVRGDGCRSRCRAGAPCTRNYYRMESV